MKNLLFVLGLALLLAASGSYAQPATWGVPIEGTDPNSQPILMEFHFVGDAWELYYGSELLVTVPREGRTPAEWAPVIREAFNQAIRDKFGISRNPFNHPIDGPLFAEVLSLLCWDKDSSQFIDPAHKGMTFGLLGRPGASDEVIARFIAGQRARRGS